MRPSLFNVRVSLPKDEVFLMNTLSDAQLIVSADVAALLDRVAGGDTAQTPEEGAALSLLEEHGFLADSHDSDRAALDRYLIGVKNDTAELNVTVLTTLQCNFACDYCFQGDHGDYNERAERMSMESAIS